MTRLMVHLSHFMILVLGTMLGMTFAVEEIDIFDQGAVFNAPVCISDSFFSKFKIYDHGGIGDFNGDGLDDLGISVRLPLGEPEDPCIDAVGVILGRESVKGGHILYKNYPLDLLFTTRSKKNDGILIESLNQVGDINGDGLSDLMLGVRYFVHPQGNGSGGTAFLAYGSSELKGQHIIDEISASIPGVQFTSKNPEHNGIGDCFSMIGDFNGDSVNDFAISAPFSSPDGRGGAGVLFVLFNIQNYPPFVNMDRLGIDLSGFLVKGHFIEGVWGEGLGFAIDPLGDIDGDGYGDFSVVSNSSNSALKNIIYIFYGQRTSPGVVDLKNLYETGKIGSDIRVKVIKGGENSQVFQAKGVGDLNGDGFDEFLLNIEWMRNIFFYETFVYLIYGGEDLKDWLQFDSDDDVSNSWTIFRSSRDSLGPIGSAGDLNGDKISDFLVGMPGARVAGKVEAGKVFAIYGKEQFEHEIDLAQGFDGLEILGIDENNQLGSSVESAGDFNGDKSPDILILAGYSFSDAKSPPRSIIVYGKPEFPKAIRRGDSNSDNLIDVSDAIVILGYRFVGNPSTLDCEKSADIDDSGEIDVTDAINLLVHLFLAGSPPPEPFQNCGPDPTKDRLTCKSFSPCN